MAVSWGAACRPKVGQSISGDTYLVEVLQENELLIAVIDGLGGGEQAALPANRAADIVRANAGIQLTEIIKIAHQALHGTRGAVIGLLRMHVSERRVSYVGLGNIGVQVYSREPIKPISKNGILGGNRLPPLLLLNYTYNSGDTFVLYSDGISSRFGLDTTLDRSLEPQAFADLIMQTHGKQNDDATVVVVRVN
ncbi:MAG: SpoIIE family protein phosphatase [Oscillochloris sp.]|nr:SpoIIE family protein phosphatase [Oscillochloris sp.]